MNFNQLLKQRRDGEQARRWGYRKVGNEWLVAEPREYKRNRAWDALEGDSKHQFGQDEAHFGWSDKEVEDYYVKRIDP